MSESVLDIVKAYLIEHGYDGLYSDGECACSLDDLEPCGNGSFECRPGVKMPCLCGEGCDYDIGSRVSAEIAKQEVP